MIVLADRYVYTAFARDVVRGVHPEWVRNLYGFAVKPNLAFYFKVPIEVSLGRILNGRISPKFHEAGMDLGLSDDASESFLELFLPTRFRLVRRTDCVHPSWRRPSTAAYPA